MSEQNPINIAYIHRTLRWLANNMVTDYEANALSPALMEKMNKLYSTLQSNLEWERLTKEECINLGFLSYGADDHEEWEVFCIPAWLYPIIPEGFRVVDCNLSEFRFYRRECPLKIDYGTLSYGLKFTNPSYKKKKGKKR